MSYTKRPLNQEEINNVLPILVKALLKTSPLKPLKAPQIVKGMNYLRVRDGKFKQVFTETLLRRMANHIRANQILPLIADNNGYYVSYDLRDIQAEIDSLEDRIGGILHAITGLKAIKQQIINDQINADPFGIKEDEWK